MLKIVRARDYEDMSQKAANVISAQIILKPDSVLGLATGSTPLGIYRRLIRWHQKGDLDFEHVRTVNLDEYRGLSREHPQSYYFFMYENLFRHINLAPDATHLPDGTNPDADAECRRYHKVLADMGSIDLQLLGIGKNGHIGFNEPDEVFPDQCHMVQLTESTVQANTRFFESKDQVPRFAYTMGIGEIMSARRILLAASGKVKAPAIRKMVCDPITPKVPASALKFHHDVTLIADEDALSLL